MKRTSLILVTGLLCALMYWSGCSSPSSTPPTVTTTSITNITTTSATSGGNVTSQGSSSVTARGVCWNTSPNPTTADSKTTDGSGTEAFTSSITNLSPSTPYHVRAYATNSAGTSYGADVPFTTTGGGGGSPCSGTSTVTYAGKTYNIVQIGSQCWLRENLDVGTSIDGSQNQTDNGAVEKYCYDNNPANCTTYGGLYQWNEAMQYSTTEGARGVCPPGWHMPTSSESAILSNTVGGDGNALKAIGQGSGGGVGTNTSGFSALVAGYRSSNESFTNLGVYGPFWSSTLRDATFANNMYLTNNDAFIALDYGHKASGFSVRCLKD